MWTRNVLYSRAAQAGPSRKYTHAHAVSNNCISAMADRWKAAVFQQYISDLQVGFKGNLSALASGFFSKKLISSDSWDRVLLQGPETPEKKAADLLRVLYSRVCTDPPAFHTILEVLHECPDLHYLEAKLRKTLESKGCADIPAAPISKQVSHLCMAYLSACILRGCLGSLINNNNLYIITHC